MLVGTAPRGQIPRTDPKVDQVAQSTTINPIDAFLFLLFSPSEIELGCWSRVMDRTNAAWAERRKNGLDIDPPTSQQTMKAQFAAIVKWREIKGERYHELKDIQAADAGRQRRLRRDGAHHQLVDAVQNIPNAQLILYPDAGHAAHFRYPELFLKHSRIFLDS